MCIEWHTTGRPAVYGISTHDRNFPIATNRRFMDARGNGREPLYARPPTGLHAPTSISVHYHSYNRTLDEASNEDGSLSFRIFRLLRNQVEETRIFLSRRCSIIQKEKKRRNDRADWIEARVKHRPHLPTLTSPPPSYIVYRRVTPRSSLVYYTYIYTRVYIPRVALGQIGNRRTANGKVYILRETGDYRTTMARGKDYGLRPQSHSDSALRRCAWPLIQKWK